MHDLLYTSEAARRTAHMRALRDDVLDADAAVDQIRRDLETLQARLHRAMTRRDDLQHLLARAVEEALR